MIDLLFILIIIFNIFGCAPYVKYQNMDSSEPKKSPQYNISIYHELDPLPSQSRIIGKLVVDNAVPSLVSCEYNDAIRLAKWKTRKVGGDAIQILNISLPDESNSCYGIEANVIVFDKLQSA